MTPEALLRAMFAAAVADADPARALAGHLPAPPASGRCIVVGAGKAAAVMAQAVEAAWPDVALTGVVVTRDGHTAPTRHIRVLAAGHPVPDARSQAAADAILAAVAGAGPGDLVLALISGGGSALMAAPVPPLTLADKITVNRVLLASGLGIADMNRIRRRLSGIKGGGLAQAVAARGARLVTLAVSDVPGDDPASIASGPTVADPDSDVDLSALVARVADLPPVARAVLLAPRLVTAPLPPADYRLIATPQRALQAAAGVARAAGIAPVLLGDAIEGEAREVGRALAGIARAMARHGTPAAAPAVLLSGGETTVTLRGAAGRGGRNGECALAMALALDGDARVHALCADTDGIDGDSDAAGAVIGPDTLERARAVGLDARAALDSHDCGTLFQRIGAAVVTGPTRTNVNDFRAVLVM